MDNNELKQIRNIEDHPDAIDLAKRLAASGNSLRDIAEIIGMKLKLKCSHTCVNKMIQYTGSRSKFNRELQKGDLSLISMPNNVLRVNSELWNMYETVTNDTPKKIKDRLAILTAISKQTEVIMKLGVELKKHKDKMEEKQDEKIDLIANAMQQAENLKKLEDAGLIKILKKPKLNKIINITETEVIEPEE
ncbi:MAG: hypothetical protein ACTSQY_00650 [Candidatus Odinarchaeia archaeon]